MNIDCFLSKLYVVYMTPICIYMAYYYISDLWGGIIFLILSLFMSSDTHYYLALNILYSKCITFCIDHMRHHAISNSWNVICVNITMNIYCYKQQNEVL